MTESLTGPPRQARAAPARPLRIASNATALACVCRPKQEAVALLSQVLARLHGLEVPVVQFVQVSAAGSPSPVARDFAEAALTRLGRTLLASLHETAVAKVELPAAAGAQALGRRRARKTAGDTPDIVPDAAVNGLFHTRIGAGCGEASQLSHVPPAVWLGEALLDFRLLVIDCGPLAENPAAVELASRCHGSILTVAAGRTLLPEVRAAARQVQIAGGTLLGSVLYDAPSKRDQFRAGWLRRLPRFRRPGE